MGYSRKRIEMGEEAWDEHVKQLSKEKSKRYRNSLHVVSWHRRTKEKLIDYKGGKCERCGYDKECPAVYHFHHKDPETKSFTISQKTFAFEKLKIEADKCLLLCANCHAELHEEEYAQIKETENNKYQEHLDKMCKVINCKVCNMEFKQKRNNQKYCSNECSETINYKVKNRPTKIELEDLIKTNSWEGIGRQFNVTGNNVKKWARSYGIEIPARNQPLVPKPCLACQNPFKPEDKDQKFCSPKCKSFSSRKFIRPPIEELLEMKKTMTVREMAEKLKVKECTLQGWFKYNP